MTDGVRLLPLPINEPVLNYAPASTERATLEAALKQMSGECPEVLLRVGSATRRGSRTDALTMPHSHGEKIAVVHEASEKDVQDAIDTAMKAAPGWAAMKFEDRAAIFLKAADLLAGPWRARINAACMLGQGKNVIQSEFDAACELIDFFRFNVHFAERVLSEQPLSVRGTWNRSDYRPLEGFVFAVTPFNFLAIALNLPTAPAMLGNVVVWKPAHATMLGVHHMMALLKEAGLPDGVINVVPGAGPAQGRVALESPHLAGIHFTGSTGTFRALWKGVAERLETYRTFPRIVGETGGKDFIVAHASANQDELATAIVRGAFEYQGQKCSAASRIYVPKSQWTALRARLADTVQGIRQGDPRDFSNFMGAVIDERAFQKISGYVDLAKNTAKIIAGGTTDSSKGWFIRPTLAEVDDPKHRLMQEEIFGPVASVYVYDDARWEDTLALVDATSPYALTGAIFAEDRRIIEAATTRLRQSAGNLYINDKPTGAVVGQQPFGGGRASGTNDKAGSLWNIARWASPRSIKETLVPPRDHRYPHMG
jgi:1-pyrroline-5-carboxylate dehydrogenase